jgi:hypothetical protein
MPLIGEIHIDARDIELIWLGYNHPAIPVARKGVFYLFKLFLPAFVAPEEGGVSTL